MFDFSVFDQLVGYEEIMAYNYLPLC